MKSIPAGRLRQINATATPSIPQNRHNARKDLHFGKVVVWCRYEVEADHRNGLPPNRGQPYAPIPRPTGHRTGSSKLGRRTRGPVLARYDPGNAGIESRPWTIYPGDPDRRLPDLALGSGLACLTHRAIIAMGEALPVCWAVAALPWNGGDVLPRITQDSQAGCNPRMPEFIPRAPSNRGSGQAELAAIPRFV